MAFKGVCAEVSEPTFKSPAVICRMSVHLVSKMGEDVPISTEEVELEVFIEARLRQFDLTL